VRYVAQRDTSVLQVLASMLACSAEERRQLGLEKEHLGALGSKWVDFLEMESSRE